MQDFLPHSGDRVSDGSSSHGPFVGSERVSGGDSSPLLGDENIFQSSDTTVFSDVQAPSLALGTLKSEEELQLQLAKVTTLRDEYANAYENLEKGYRPFSLMKFNIIGSGIPLPAMAIGFLLPFLEFKSVTIGLIGAAMCTIAVIGAHVVGKLNAKKNPDSPLVHLHDLYESLDRGKLSKESRQAVKTTQLENWKGIIGGLDAQIAIYSRVLDDTQKDALLHNIKVHDIHDTHSVASMTDKLSFSRLVCAIPALLNQAEAMAKHVNSNKEALVNGKIVPFMLHGEEDHPLDMELVRIHHLKEGEERRVALDDLERFLTAVHQSSLHFLDPSEIV